MAKKKLSQKRWAGGISDYPKENAAGQVKDSYFFSRAIDIRTDPQAITLLPRAVKESGSQVVDLLKWGDRVPTTLNSYFVGDQGYFYQRNTDGAWGNLHQVSDSTGQGLAYFTGDDYIYYSTTSSLGRFGPAAYAPVPIESWLEGSIDATKWNRNFSTGLETLQTGQVTMTIATGVTVGGNIQSYQSYSIQSQRIVVNLISAGNQADSAWSCGIGLFTNNAQVNGVEFNVTGGNAVAAKTIAGTTSTITSSTYSATTMKYLAISESNGTIIFETSPDGITFTQFSTLVNPFNTTDFYIVFGCDTTSGAASTTSAIFGSIMLNQRSGVAQFTDNFLKAAGGIPTNVASVVLVSASSQYAHAADSGTLDIVSDITLETYFKANSLPAVGSSMTLVGKWDESSTTRAYKLDLFGVSGYFGTGADSSLTISTNTIEAPIDSAASGSDGSQQVFATNASFASGQVVLVIQMQGANAGQWERALVQSYTAGVITLATPLIGTYTNVSGATAQVRVLKQYTSVTINSGVTYIAKAWNGTTGGIIGFLANGTVTNNNFISATDCGFRGGADGASGIPHNAVSGEGRFGLGTNSNAANDFGGGGASSSGTVGAGGGGGSYATIGNFGGTKPGLPAGAGATALGGSADLTTLNLGGGGGSGGSVLGEGAFGGANGGGIIFIVAATFTNVGTGALVSNGGPGNVQVNAGSSGGGAGGSILLKVQNSTLLTSTQAIGGAGGASQNGGNGGTGGNGRIAIYYLTTIIGTTTPTAITIQDNTLVTTPSTQVRLSLSSTGSNSEILTQNLPALVTGTWNRLSVSWKASLSQASFYLNGNPLGVSTGALTSLHNGTGLLTVGANNSGSGIANYFNGELNDMRIFNVARNADAIFNNFNVQIPTVTPGLVAYYKFNNALTDATSNANNLTGVNTPTFTTDVPFSNPTTRLDIDTQNTNTGNTYTLPTAIIEDSTDSLPFTPINDPQASVGFFIGSKGTGNVTLTVHDTQNRIVAQQTILAASIPASGFIEFIFNTVWRVLLNASYHMHLTVSTGTTTVVTGTSNDFSTAEYTSYYGFLVPEAQFHPIIQFQYQPLGGSLTGAEIIGNERYLAVWDGANYLPNFITFPPGWHVRCFGFWRQYLAVGMTRGDSVQNWNTGRIYFWSGYQPVFDFFIDVPTGQVNALYGIDTDLYFVAGYQGFLMDYQGGYFYNNGNTQSEKLKRMPLLQDTDIVEVYPGAITMWHGYLHLGLWGQSNSTTTQQGVYSWGAYNQFYPSVLTYDYTISTGNTGNSVTIGLLFPIGDELIVGWRDGVGTGADVVSAENPPAASGEIQSLIFDNGNIWKNERVYQLKADILSLRTGESVATKYNIDRSGWILANPANDVDMIDSDTFTKQYIAGTGYSREVQMGVELYSTNGTSPTVLGLSMLYDDTDSEDIF